MSKDDIEDNKKKIGETQMKRILSPENERITGEDTYCRKKRIEKERYMERNFIYIIKRQ